MRRNTAYQEPLLPPLAESGLNTANESRPLTHPKDSSNVSNLNSASQVVDTDASHGQVAARSEIRAQNEQLSTTNETDKPTKVEGIYIEDNGEIKVYDPHNSALNVTARTSGDGCPIPATHTEENTQKSGSNTAAKTSAGGPMIPYDRNDATVDPEETWEEDVDEDYQTNRSQLYGDNTIGATTVVLFPEYSLNVRRELSVAKQIVESTRTAQDYEDECYDPTMVAEYGEEIFEYMKNLEVHWASFRYDMAI